MAQGEIEEQSGVAINLSNPDRTEYGNDELGQIRGLLFGGPAREILDRVDAVERELLRGLEALTNAVDERFELIDRQISSEAANRSESVGELSSRIEEESRANKDAQIDLRTNVDRRSAEIRQQIGTARADLSAQIDLVDSELRGRHVDKESLASLFERAAASLNDVDE